MLEKIDGFRLFARLRSRAQVLNAILLVAAVTPVMGQTAAPSALPDLKTAETLGAELFARSGSTGMVLVVARGDQVFFHGYGETAPMSGQAPTTDSVLRLCSLTKIFTTDVLTKLVQDKTVRLQDPLQRYAPAHVVVPIRNKIITLEELATHMSGLPRELGTAPRNTPHFTFPDHATRWRWLPNQYLRSTPGSAALYSNVGFDLLGDALATGAHKQYAALLEERTLQPLNMYGTTYFPNAEQCARLLMGSYDEGPCTSTEETAGSSGLYSTPRDMAIWLKYLLGAGGPGLPAQNAAAQASYLRVADLTREEGLDHAGRPYGIGLGWLHLGAPGDPSEIVEKTGGGAGFSTYIALHHPSRTAIFVATTDGAGESHTNLFKGANNILLALAGLPPLPEDAPKPARKHVRKRRAH
jgi:D-alanyl-D-alanine-carboxypeptidase/D-alanyl-D-alanine-endopeptidase